MPLAHIMTEMQAGNINQLTINLLDEVFLALGVKTNGLPRKTLWPIFWLPANRFARLALNFDGIVTRSGLREAAWWLLDQYVSGYEARGIEHIPQEGPLLIASNHPGAFDSLVVTANVMRDDLKIIVSGVPFLRSLHGLKKHFIYLTEDTQVRMMALRSALRHLRSGGALLLFATGLVDPDPSFLPGAQQALLKWSGSLDVFMHKAPETQVLVSIVSGVLAPECMRNPLVRLNKMEPWEQRRIAEYIQTMQQLVFQRNYYLFPKVTFSEVIPKDLIQNESGSPEARDVIVSWAQCTLEDHLDWIHSDNRP